MRTYRRLFQIFFLALILGSASGCAMFQPADPGYNDPQRAQNIVRTASSQEGKQYRMGGASPSRGFDCSGLIWWAYRQNGLKVPRVTVDQARAGYAVPKSAPHGLQDQQRPPRPAHRHLCGQQYLHPQPQPRQDRAPGQHGALLGRQAHRGTPHRHLIPLAGKDAKKRGYPRFFHAFSGHPARQAAFPAGPPIFLCGHTD